LFNIVLNNFDGLDGVFVENDLIALEFIDYATRFGYKIPEDINVIGFDGIQKNNLFKPRLSTIVQPIAKLGEEAVNMLMERLSGEQEIKKLILPVSYFDGDTTRKI
ncbi:MAG: substrate-binding domain-containing protein, partial [Leptotrichiaceae bacterium]